MTRCWSNSRCFYNNPRSEDCAVSLTAHGVSINTDPLAKQYLRVVVVVSVDDGAFDADATAALRQPSSEANFQFGPGAPAGLSLLVWETSTDATATGASAPSNRDWSDGLAGLARLYGVNVD